MRAYVRRKLPLSELRKAQRIPPSIGGFFTDVITVGGARLHARPVALGAGIGRVGGERGTLGCVVQKKGDSSWYILSAAHVLAPDSTARKGDLILEPASSDGGTEPIAELSEFVTLNFDEGTNRVDVATARMFRRRDVALRVPRIGKLAGEPLAPFVFQSVRKNGATTFHTLGVVTAVRETIEFDGGIGRTLTYEGVYEITGCGGPFSQPGDSGAVVVDALTNRPIGMLVAGVDVRSYVLPIERVLKKFDLEIVAADRS